MNITETDSWVILSPFRTGSAVIVDCIRKSYNSKQIHLKHFEVKDKLERVPPGSIRHCHDLEILNYLNGSTRVVISTRDIFESALSFQLAQQYGQWHYYYDQVGVIADIKKQVPKFTVDKQTLVDQIAATTNWYRLVPDNLIRIDYKEFENQLSVVYHRLNLPIPSDIDMMPMMKNPYLLKEWVVNWNEIKCLSNLTN